MTALSAAVGARHSHRTRSVMPRARAGMELRPGRRIYIAVTLIALVLFPSPGAADPCAPGAGARVAGPLQAGLREGGLGLARRACPRTELALGGEGWAVVELADFYGQLRGAMRLSGSYALSDRSELHAALEMLRYQTVISSLSAAYTGIGHLTLGGTHRLVVRDRSTVAASARLVLPTATGAYRNVWPIGGDLGLAAGGMWAPALRWHAQASMITSAALAGAAPLPRLGLAATAGGQWLPRSWLSLVLELQSALGYHDVFDVLATAVGLRTHGTRVHAELSVVVPLLGQERKLASALLQGIWQF